MYFLFFNYGFSESAFPNAIKYRMLIEKIDKLEKEYVEKLPKSTYIAGALEELIKDLPAEDQVFFMISMLKLLAERFPHTHKHLLKKVFKGITSHLDPYSIYLAPRDFKNIIGMGKGEIAGVGLELIEKEGRIEVIAPIKGSPADKAGIKSNDIITHIDGESVVPQREVLLHKLRGKPGSTVNLIIERAQKKISVKLIREIVDILPVQADFYQNIAYIKINYFAKNITNDLRKHLKYLSTQAIKGIVLDLRHTPGGVFEEGVTVSGLFLPANKRILIVKSRQNRYNRTYYSQEKDYVKNIPLVVLISEGTASAAEIVVSCLKDHERAEIIGVTTLGKASIQDIVPVAPISKFGGFKYTVAKFYSPHGHKIHNEGITPHIEILNQNEIQSSYNLNLPLLYDIDCQFRKAVQFFQDTGNHG